MITQFAIIFTIPLVLSLLITPIVRWYARRIGALDQPNERKIHKNPVPRLGGLAIYVSFFVSFVILFHLSPTLHTFFSLNPHNGVILVLSLTLVILLGVWDDLRSLSPWKKLLVQWVAASIVYLAGFQISSITHPFSDELLELGIFGYPLTLLWIIGITNAFNLIDGLDGLSSGLAVISSLTMFAISYLRDDITSAMMALLLAGAILGFLRYNFNKASIFLGDSGSLFIGFSLAMLSIQSSTKGSTAFSIIIPVLALGLPIMDTLLSMTRRLLGSILPQQEHSKSFLGRLSSMFIPDRGHIHHRLIARGLSDRKVLMILYFVSCAFCIGAFAVTVSNNVVVSLVLFSIAIATFIGIKQLRYKEMAVLRNGVFLPLYEWPLVNSTLFQGFLDLGFMSVAYTISYLLTTSSELSFKFGRPFMTALTVACGIQLVIFYLAGLYKSTFRQIGIPDLLKILKAVSISIIVTWIVLRFLPQVEVSISGTQIILHFYILLSLVVGARVSFAVLNYVFQQHKLNGGKRVLIYGTDTKSLLLLQQIINDDTLNCAPIGFLDDNPHLEGKRLNGYPIFGGHWKLRRLLNTMKIDEILVSSDSVRPEVLNRLIEISRAHGVAIQRSNIQLEDCYSERKQRQPLQIEFALGEKLGR